MSQSRDDSLLGVLCLLWALYQSMVEQNPEGVRRNVFSEFIKFLNGRNYPFQRALFLIPRTKILQLELFALQLFSHRSITDTECLFDCNFDLFAKFPASHINSYANTLFAELCDNLLSTFKDVTN